MYFFAFCVYKNVSEYKICLYINWNYNNCHQQKTMCTLYIQKEKKCETVFYKKSKTILVLFLYTKCMIIFVMRFSWKFWIVIYIQKARHFVLCDVFIYIKPDILQKARKCALHFIYRNPHSLRYAMFHWIFEIGGGGWTFVL